MQHLNVREMRASMGQLDELVAKSGELIVTRNGKPIARILPAHSSRKRPAHKNLRARTPLLSIPSETLIRGERDED